MLLWLRAQTEDVLHHRLASRWFPTVRWCLVFRSHLRCHLVRVYASIPEWHFIHIHVCSTAWWSSQNRRSGQDVLVFKESWCPHHLWGEDKRKGNVTDKHEKGNQTWESKQPESNSHHVWTKCCFTSYIWWARITDSQVSNESWRF